MSAEAYDHVKTGEGEHIYVDGECACGVISYTYDETTNTYTVYTHNGLQAALANGGTIEDFEFYYTVVITGGTHGSDPTSYVDTANYTVTNNGNGTYTVILIHKQKLERESVPPAA